MGDRLRPYEEKRRFDVTPEPPPDRGPSREEGRSFMIHKHHARRLHYDLRLEIEGALASWAVPKGPSLDPADKRLAVETEDHPLAYGDFEGRIPDGQYGAGDSLIWDRGTFDTVPPGQAAAQRAKGHLHLRFEGEKLRGDWHLVRTRRQGGKQQWILFKAKDEHADPDRDLLEERPESVVSGRVLTRGPETRAALRTIRPPPRTLLEGHLPPMLAQLERATGARLRQQGWFETKYDGFRALAAVSHGRVALLSRNGLDLEPRFPHIAAALGELVVGDAVLDGEVAILDERGVSRFERIQWGRNDEAWFFAFDLLRLDGEDLRPRPLRERRDLLVSLLSNAEPPLALSEVFHVQGREALDLAEARGWEGVVRKDPSSRWVRGRSSAWRKWKIHADQEFVVVGFTRTSTGGDAIGSLLLAVWADGGFEYVGKVGTGFSAKERSGLFHLLMERAVERPPVRSPPRMRGATWVEPELVVQVRFAEWTADGMLRQPALVGFRTDKRPEEVVREVPAEQEPPAADGTTEGKDAMEPRLSKKELRLFDEVRLTHPERILYPRDGITKADVLGYYREVAQPLLAALRDRPLAFQHWNEGIDAPGWFHQNIGNEAAPWMTLVDAPSQSGRRTIRRLLVDSPLALGWLAQNSVLTVHMWSSRIHHLEEPDWVVFDLDPADGEGVEQAIDVAHAVRVLLDELSLPSLAKTSGKRGLHVLVPLLPGHTHRQAVDFALWVARAVEEVLPQVTLERSKDKRAGRLYLDCFQNGFGKTIVAPYSLRGEDGAPVSAPLRWDEVRAGLDPKAFNLHTMGDRLEEVGDLFAAFRKQAVRLPAF